MLLPTTLDVIRAALRADPTPTPGDRARLLQLIRNGAKPPAAVTAPVSSSPRILRRAQVADRLGCSLRTVDKLPLKKIKLPGRRRAAGFLESDFNAMLAGKEVA